MHCFDVHVGMLIMSMIKTLYIIRRFNFNLKYQDVG